MSEGRSNQSRGRTKTKGRRPESVMRFKLFGWSFVARPPRLRYLGFTIAASLPAILGMVSAIAAMAGMVNESKDRTVASYREKIVSQPSNGSLPKLVYERVIAFTPSDVDVWESYLNTLDKLGENDRASGILSNLAPDDGKGDPRFHLKLAKRLQTVTPLSSKSNFLIEKHLKIATENATGDLAVQARRQLSLYQLVKGDRETAFNTLLPIMMENPVAGSEALWIAWTSGLEMDISAPGKVMARLDRDLRGSSVPSNDNAVAKMRLMSILNQESAAREWLGTQRNIKPEDRQLIESEVSEMVLIASIIRSGESKTPDWSKLEPLLARDPNHPMWSRLAVALWAAPPKPENEAARIWVQKRLDEGTSADTILRYSILASSAKYNTTGTKAEDSKVLRGLYRKLLASQPDDVIALNNLSMLIYKYEPDHLDEALKYATHAAKLAPRVPAVRDTVGEILARQGRWDEALPILESCISDLPEEWNLHNTLAQIYDRKGLKDRAAAHKSALERIKRPLDAANYDKLPQPGAVIPLRNPTPVGS